MQYHCLRLEFERPLARLTLMRPGDANRIDGRMLVELADAVETIAAADGVSLVVLDAAGADFSAGWADGAAEALLAQLPDEASKHDPFGCLARLPFPVLAVIQGGCYGAGLELALAADVRVCGDDATFGLSGIDDGRLPLAGGSQRLPRIVGRSRAAGMLLLDDELDAASALSAGLVSRVFATDSLAADASELARRIASRGPIALRYAKEAVHNGLEMTLEHGLRYELDLSIILQTTADRAEGVRAFLEKRPPEFTGE